MSKEVFGEDMIDPDFINDREQPLLQRLDVAKYQASNSEPVVVPVARLAVCDGQEVPDQYIGTKEFMKVLSDNLGFPPDQYEGTQYDARTKSTLHPEYTLQMAERPLDLGGPSEAFPGGQAWSKYDYNLDVNIIVTPST